MFNKFKKYIASERIVLIITITVIISVRVLLFFLQKSYDRADSDQSIIEATLTKQIDSIGKIYNEILVYDSINKTYNKYLAATGEYQKELDSITKSLTILAEYSDTLLISSESKINYLKKKEEILIAKKIEIERLIFILDSISPNYTSNFRNSIGKHKINLEKELHNHLMFHESTLENRGTTLSFIETFIYLYLALIYPFRWLLLLIFRNTTKK